jgi:hypothetical protein
VTRPHEDLERHTFVDHRGGGQVVDFALGAWCAVDVAHVGSDRVDAGISAYETLIEKARTSSAKAGPAVVLRSDDKRSVLSLVEVGGHEAFSHLKSAWGERHLYAEHRAVATSIALHLYRVAARLGEPAIDPASTDAYGFERTEGDAEAMHHVVPAVVAAPGFVGALVFGDDDGFVRAVLYRFRKRADIASFRGAAAFGVHPVKSFGVLV